MIKKMTDIKPYQEFISMIMNDSKYKDPMLSNEEQVKHNLIDAILKEDYDVIGVFKDDRITGIFVFLKIALEKYAEMIVGLSRDFDAYEELFTYLFQNYKGYKVDFVYNPNNDILNYKLKALAASFEVEQQKMKLVHYQKCNRRHNIVLYEEKYKEGYLSIHNNEDTYWVGKKVIEAFDQFRVILCVLDDEVVGFVDITYQFDENEPYDVFVVPKYRNQSIATEMLSLAIELNGNKELALLVDITNKVAIHLYERLGFIKTEGNNITAHLNIKQNNIMNIG